MPRPVQGDGRGKGRVKIRRVVEWKYPSVQIFGDISLPW